jgi:hypothetical protein
MPPVDQRETTEPECKKRIMCARVSPNTRLTFAWVLFESMQTSLRLVLWSSATLLLVALVSFGLWISRGRDGSGPSKQNAVSLDPYDRGISRLPWLADATSASVSFASGFRKASPEGQQLACSMPGDQVMAGVASELHRAGYVLSAHGKQGRACSFL